MNTQKLSDEELGRLSSNAIWLMRSDPRERSMPAELLAARRKLAAVEELVKALEFYGDEYHYKDGYVTLCCGCCTGFEKADILDEQGKRARLALEKWRKS